MFRRDERRTRWRFGELFFFGIKTVDVVPNKPSAHDIHITSGDEARLAIVNRVTPASVGLATLPDGHGAVHARGSDHVSVPWHLPLGTAQMLFNMSLRKYGRRRYSNHLHRYGEGCYGAATSLDIFFHFDGESRRRWHVWGGVNATARSMRTRCSTFSIQNGMTPYFC